MHKFRKLTGLCLFLCLLCPAHAGWLVRTGDPQVRQKMRAHAAEMRQVHSYRNFPWAVYAGNPAAEKNFHKKVDTFKLPAIPAGKVRLARLPDDPLFPQQPAFHHPAPDADIHLTEAWDLTTDTDGVVIAVIDSGLDVNHEDLKNNLWTNPAEAQGVAGQDDDGNGLVDDLHGWNFASFSNDLAGTDSLHGTAVSGVIGAEGNNGVGVSGVCWKTRLMVLKAFAGDTTDMPTILAALDYALDHPEVRIINASWTSGEEDAALREAIMIAGQHGVLVVAAAGNNGQGANVGANLASIPFYPASYAFENVVSVAAVDSEGKLASFSNYGANVTLAAPGVSIYTTGPGNAYIDENGTSFSAPIVSGAAALLLARNPGLSPSQVRNLLVQNARRTPQLEVGQTLGGLLDVSSLLNLTVTAVRDWQLYDR